MQGERRMNILIHAQGTHRADIFMTPSKVDDEGVALLQALLSEGLATSLHGVGERAGLGIFGCTSLPVLTPAEFRSLVAPLLPYVTSSLGSDRKVVYGSATLYGRI